MPTSWPEVLDQLEDFVVGARDHIERGTPSPAFPSLKPDIGPMPPELADRATRLLEEIHSIEDRYQVIRDRMAHLLALILEDPPPPPPSYMDRSF